MQRPRRHPAAIISRFSVAGRLAALQARSGKPPKFSSMHTSACVKIILQVVMVVAPAPGQIPGGAGRQALIARLAGSGKDAVVPAHLFATRQSALKIQRVFRRISRLSAREHAAEVPGFRDRHGANRNSNPATPSRRSGSNEPTSA
ncbi:MAG: hypothetical protein M0R28_13695 [Pigmentiphaga sp.]|nr:hypothetical protein [Pigmentiphaga sp.]